jgi:hypothetical protein
LAVSTVAQIIEITDEVNLVAEMKIFDKAMEKRIEPIELLLAVDVRSQSQSEQSVEDHMSKIEAQRQAAVRLHSLSACFLEHAKSPYFRLKKGKDISEDDRRSKEKMLVAPFTGMTVRTEGLVKSIDSRVNLCKMLLKLFDERVNGKR